MTDRSGSISSMTGFARQEGGDGVLSWIWEVKSVNARGLDLRCRVPAGYEALEGAARARAKAYCSRGNLQITLTIDRSQRPVKLRINREVLDQLTEFLRELEGQVTAAPPRLDGVLALRGVVEEVEETETAAQSEARAAAMVADLDSVLEALRAMRRVEGRQLEITVSGHLDEIERQSAAALETAAVGPEALRARLRDQVAELLEASPALSEDRLAQEAAVLAVKADVREELDRLRIHAASARELLAQGGPVGRRLDFLCQELNREANTLCAKSWDIALTEIGLETKAVVDQLREQVQNIE